MKYILPCLLIVVAAVVLFLIADYLLKRYKKPLSADEAIWKAVYFIQIGQYQQALDLLALAEQEYAMFPEMMCDLCIQRADAYRGLNQPRQAVDAYETLYEALQECERKIKRNDSLLEEMEQCYQQAERMNDFEKWHQLFNEEKSNETT